MGPEPMNTGGEEQNADAAMALRSSGTVFMGSGLGRYAAAPE
jgi:hypothetical protein